ncbi:MAG: hypothetical protein GF416_04840 [Candidatus Altiarchaeales archaeon]|nr:hypothetical protein [Candidatus Altiarchaeales archaeon]
MSKNKQFRTWLEKTFTAPKIEAGLSLPFFSVAGFEAPGATTNPQPRKRAK